MTRDCFVTGIENICKKCKTVYFPHLAMKFSVRYAHYDTPETITVIKVTLCGNGEHYVISKGIHSLTNTFSCSELEHMQTEFILDFQSFKERNDFVKYCEHDFSLMKGE